MSQKQHSAVAASVDKAGKINLPLHSAERLYWARREGPTDCWLYIVHPGRYRLLSEEDVKRSEVLSQTLERITGAIAVEQLEDPADAESSASAVLSATLAPASLSFNTVSRWRLAISKATYPMTVIVNHAKVFVIFSQGYLEIWLPDTLEQALAGGRGELAG